MPNAKGRSALSFGEAALLNDGLLGLDLNQDGISQTGELQTLAQTGIASIGVQGNFATINLGQGNSQIASGTYTRTDGTSGASGVAELTGSLLLASNNFYSEFTDNPAISKPAQALPQSARTCVHVRMRISKRAQTHACRYTHLRRTCAVAQNNCTSNRTALQNT